MLETVRDAVRRCKKSQIAPLNAIIVIIITLKKEMFLCLCVLGTSTLGVKVRRTNAAGVSTAAPLSPCAVSPV